VQYQYSRLDSTENGFKVAPAKNSNMRLSTFLHQKNKNNSQCAELVVVVYAAVEGIFEYTCVRMSTNYTENYIHLNFAENTLFNPLRIVFKLSKDKTHENRSQCYEVG